MGAAYGLWIGPYAKCTTPTVTAWATINTCSNAECHLRCKHASVGKTAKFCSKCGSPAEEIKAETEREVAEVSANEVSEALCDKLRLFNAEYGEATAALWVPNICNDALPRPMNIDAKYDQPVGEIVQVVNPTTVTNDLEWFHDQFAGSLLVMREAYGKANVMVLWGLLGEVQ